MRDASVSSLLGAVRRRLWRERGRVAVRRAAWLSAATMLLAAAVHLAVTPLRVDVVGWLLVLEWSVLLASAAWRRPSDADCALWIDRHLGGASAFTTLLDATAKAPAHAQALRWLEQWAIAKVPAVLRALAERPPSAPVSRALLSMVVCSALALFVLTLPDTGPARRAGAESSAAAGDSTTPSIEVPVTARLASEMATALRPPDAPGERPQRRAGDSPGAGPTRADDGSGSPGVAARATALPPDAAPMPDSRSRATVDAGTSVGTGRSAAASGGRDAGDSADTRADLGVSRAPATGIAGARSVSKPPSPAAERRADMDEAGRFDDAVGAPPGAMPGAVVAAAAAPPPAVATARLSAAEAGYVEAWMKATGRSR